MSEPMLKVLKLYPDAKLPIRANPTDSGLDVFIHHFERGYTRMGDERLPIDLPYYNLCQGDRVFISIGISLAVKPKYEVQVRPRSGLALKKGLTIVNSPGTIDCSYRGPVGVIVLNTGFEPVLLNRGDKIAQLVVCPVSLSDVVEVNDLDETPRGTGGFGSTGSA